MFQLDGILAAKDMNLYTLAIDGDSEAIGKKYAHEFECIDITNKNLVFEYALKKKIDGIVSIASDVSMPALGYVVSNLGIVGYDFNLIDSVNNKDVFFSVLDTNNIKIPKTISFKNKLPKKVFKTKKYIIKPSKGSGSRGVSRGFRQKY